MALVEARPGSDLVTLTRAQETDLPASAKIRSFPADDDYRQAVAEARRLAGASGRMAQADLAIVLDDGLAAASSRPGCSRAWAARERAQLFIAAERARDRARRRADVRSGDAQPISARDGSVRARRARRSKRSASIPMSMAASATAGAPGADASPRFRAGSPAAAFLDLPLLTGSGSADGGICCGRAAALARRHRSLRFGADDGVCIEEHGCGAGDVRANARSAGAGPEGRIDWAARLRVKLSYGTLTSADLVTVLWRAKRGGSPERGRRVGSRTVPQRGAGRCRNLPAERAAARTSGNGRRDAARRLPECAVRAAQCRRAAGRAERRINCNPLQLALWPANRDIGDASYQTVQHAFTGLGLRPYSPAAVAGVRNGGGDLALSWCGGRASAATAGRQTEVPLSEDASAMKSTSCRARP